jgi:hypothetical protein
MGSGGMIYNRTKFHGNMFRHLSNITGVTAKIFEVVMLVLLICEIYIEYAAEVASCSMIYVVWQ